MNQKVKLEDLSPIMLEVLENGGEVTLTSTGISMMPLLQHRKDRVVLGKIDGTLKKYDIPLYKRDNGQYVLHRIVKVNADGTYNMCGDHQTQVEKGVRHEQLLGVVKRFTHAGAWCETNNIWYVVYEHIWVWSRGLRKLYFICRSLPMQVARKIYYMFNKKSRSRG
ncbi:MAG: S24/S26 family peptidase [Lachnospiraceae bacterium]